MGWVKRRVLLRIGGKDRMHLEGAGGLFPPPLISVAAGTGGFLKLRR